MEKFKSEQYLDDILEQTVRPGAKPNPFSKGAIKRRSVALKKDKLNAIDTDYIKTTADIDRKANNEINRTSASIPDKLEREKRISTVNANKAAQLQRIKDNKARQKERIEQIR